jgi:hypothetical protein
MHAISLHLVLYAFEETLMWWKLNFNSAKPNGALDNADLTQSQWDTLRAHSNRSTKMLRVHMPI